MKWKNKGREFDAIGEKIKNIKTVYFYGIGGHATEILELLRKLDKYVKWDVILLDRNKDIQGSKICGWEIKDPNSIWGDVKENDFFVSCPLGKTGDEIRDIILSHGIQEDMVAYGFDFLYTLLPVFFMYRYDMVFFTSQSIVPSTACNLNCRDCLNFNPHMKKHIVYTVEQVKENIDLFFNAVDLIYRFQFTGGEPLLYPNLREVIKYTKDKYDSQIIRLEMVTNGTVVPSDEMCQFLSENAIYVFLDDYTMSLDQVHCEKRKEIEQKFKEFNVNYCNNYVEKWYSLYPNDYVRNEEESEKFYDICKNPFSSVENGYIESCNYALYAEKAGLVKMFEEEKYDLTKYDKSKRKELLEFRLRYNEKGYAALCSKCKGFCSINMPTLKPAIQVGRI